MPGYSINDALDTDWDTLIKVISINIDDEEQDTDNASKSPKSQQKAMDLGDFIKSI